ncbi:MAG: fimbrillin family protein [Parabacteroides sp.]|nr:fimbrillin family protein [Parabacteroides sp.]
MNYTKQIIIAASTLAFCLPSCTNEALIDNRLLGKELVVSAEIVSSATQQETRVGALGAVGASSYDKTSFFDDDQILISKTGETDGVLYHKLGTRWLPVSGQTPLTVSSSAETFTGVYPHDFSMIYSNQTDNGSNTGDNFKKSNKLMAEAKTTTSGNSVKFQFSPAFCKMTVTITLTDARSDVTATLTASGICTDPNNTGSISLLRTSSNTASTQHSFICIFNPGTYATHSLAVQSTDASSATISDSYTYTSSKTFEKGKNYIYNFTSTNDLILTDIKVTDFTEGSPNDVGSAT